MYQLKNMKMIILWCFLLLWLKGFRGISLREPHRGTFGWATCCFRPFQAEGIALTCSGPRERDGTSRNGVRRSNSPHALEPESVQTSTPQAYGCEFELKTSPDHSLIPERQVTTREIDLVARRFYYSFLVAASTPPQSTLKKT